MCDAVKMEWSGPEGCDERAAQERCRERVGPGWGHGQPIDRVRKVLNTFIADVLGFGDTFVVDVIGHPDAPWTVEGQACQNRHWIVQMWAQVRNASRRLSFVEMRSGVRMLMLSSMFWKKSTFRDT